MCVCVNGKRGRMCVCPLCVCHSLSGCAFVRLHARACTRRAVALLARFKKEKEREEARQSKQSAARALDDEHNRRA